MSRSCNICLRKCIKEQIHFPISYLYQKLDLHCEYCIHYYTYKLIFSHIPCMRLSYLLDSTLNISCQHNTKGWKLNNKGSSTVPWRYRPNIHTDAIQNEKFLLRAITHTVFNIPWLISIFPSFWGELHQLGEYREVLDST